MLCRRSNSATTWKRISNVENCTISKSIFFNKPITEAQKIVCYWFSIAERWIWSWLLFNAAERQRERKRGIQLVSAPALAWKAHSSL